MSCLQPICLRDQVEWCKGRKLNNSHKRCPGCMACINTKLSARQSEAAAACFMTLLRRRNAKMTPHLSHFLPNQLHSALPAERCSWQPAAKLKRELPLHHMQGPLCWVIEGYLRTASSAFQEASEAISLVCSQHLLVDRQTAQHHMQAFVDQDAQIHKSQSSVTGKQRYICVAISSSQVAAWPCIHPRHLTPT